DEAAAAELGRFIHKEDFAAMRVVGQFNLGFIIARLGADLFIVDQHASDEKYNYEELQRTMKIDPQRLIRPLQLDLTAHEELLASEHLDILKKNGFDVSIDPTAPPTQRTKLLSVPHSGGGEPFGKKDFEELLHKLGEDTGETVRCSRVSALIASKACRKSVMIGKALDAGQMRRILLHMGMMDQPWNCPHGRPTMRHLVDL
ncbi:MutL C terminal dimerization domain-containing protein, partial [Blyttiomyces helicus]